MPLTLIAHRSEHFLVLLKPHGLPTTAKTATDDESETLVTWALEQCPELGAVSESGLLHRLDTDTSGLVAFARSERVWQQAREAWSTDAVSKGYEALSIALGCDAPLPPAGLIWDRPIAHSAKSRSKMIVLPTREKSRGEPQTARTQVLDATRVDDGLIHFKLRIFTGVRHQIRVHLSTAGYPILGDSLYAPTEYRIGRLRLHSSQIGIRLPGMEALDVRSPPGPDFFDLKAP
jgi:23S rRNA pseudouridine1911/1915/1917 synthase